MERARCRVRQLGSPAGARARSARTTACGWRACTRPGQLLSRCSTRLGVSGGGGTGLSIPRHQLSDPYQTATSAVVPQRPPTPSVPVCGPVITLPPLPTQQLATPACSAHALAHGAECRAPHLAAARCRPTRQAGRLVGRQQGPQQRSRQPAPPRAFTDCLTLTGGAAHSSSEASEETKRGALVG